MKRLLTVIFLVVFLFPVTVAQWVSQSSGTTESIFSIAAPGPFTAYAVGSYGLKLKTTDGGSSWNPMVGGPTGTITSVQFTDENTGHFTNNNGTYYKTTDGGSTWSSTGLYNGIPYCVDFPSANIGYIGGNKGYILKTTDAGKNWTSQNTGLSFAQTIYSIQFYDDNLGWAVGTVATIMRTTDGGAHWTQIENTFGYTEFHSVHFIDAFTGFIGGTINQNDSAYILKTTNGGLVWTKKALPYQVKYNSVESIWFVDALTGFAVGSGGMILKTEDAGETWVIQNSGTTEMLLSAHFYSTTTGYVVGMNGTILEYRSIYTPVNGNFSALPVTGRVPLDVQFTDESTGGVTTWKWNFGDGSNSQLQNPLHTYTTPGTYTVTLTASNGTSTAIVKKSGFIIAKKPLDPNWIDVPSGTTSTITSIDFANSNEVYAGCENGSILKSTNGGTTWNTLRQTEIFTCPKIQFTEPSIGYAAGFKEIIKTTDGGVNWTKQNISFAGWLSSMYFVSTQVGFAVGGGMTNGEVARTTDGGSNWNISTVASPTILQSVFFLNETTGWVGGEGMLLKTTNAGATWSPRTSPGTSNVAQIWFLDTSKGFVISDYSILMTTDGGTTWTKKYDGSSKGVIALKFIDQNNAWGVGSSGLLLLTTDGGELWTERDAGNDGELNCIDFYDAEHGLIGGSSGIIFKFHSSTTPSTPIAAFTADITSGIAPLTVQFTDQSANTPTSWSWDFGDGGTSTEQNPSHQYINAGSYTVVLNVTNGAGSDALTKTDYITVSSGGGVARASIPFHESFESIWIDKDGGLNSAPSAFWTNIPSTSDSSWRRNDYSVWASGTYTPPGANGTSKSARFHSFLALAGRAGKLDLAIDFSTASGSKELKFYFTNATGSDILEVYISSDGGNNFGLPIGSFTTTSNWEEKTIQLGTINSTNGVIRFKAISDWGNDDIGLDEVSVTSSTDATVTQLLPVEFRLEQNYPNPFNPSTTITYQIPNETFVTLKVFNVLGQEIQSLVQANQSAGHYSIQFNAHELSSGLYFYKLTAGNNSIIKKMNLIK